MDDTERLVALKRAYAETILNTAKEAAARVLASERKSLSLQRDLRLAKSESLRLLLRLNQITHHKSSEAEKTAFRQQRRIEELEAQLQEAEGIIVDLREELKLAHNKLKKGKDYQLQHFNGKNPKEDGSLAERVTNGAKSISGFEPIVPYASDSEIEPRTDSKKDSPMNNSNQNSNSSTTNKQSEQTNLSNSEQICGQDSALTSSIMRNYESELCENDCTQTIHSFDGDFVDRALSISANIEPQSPRIKNKFIVVAEDGNEENCSVPTESKSKEIMKKTSKRECKIPVKGHKRRRKSYFGESKVSTCRSRRQQLLKSFKHSAVNPKYMKLERDTPEDSACKSDELNGGKNIVETQERLSRERVNDKDNIQIIHKGKRKQNVRTRFTVFDSSNSGKAFVFSPCKNKPMKSAGNCMLKKLSMTEAEPKIQQLHCRDPEVTLIKSQADSESAKVATSINLLDTCGAVGDAEDKERKCTSPSINKEYDIQNSAVPGCELSPKKVNVEVITADNICEEVKGSLTLADESQLLKYQRKRKKECLSNLDEENNPERSAIKRRAEEKQDDASESQKVNCINDTSRVSRRVAQVARQLIALSGTRSR